MTAVAGAIFFTDGKLRTGWRGVPFESPRVRTPTKGSRRVMGNFYTSIGLLAALRRALFLIAPPDNGRVGHFVCTLEPYEWCILETQLLRKIFAGCYAPTGDQIETL